MLFSPDFMEYFAAVAPVLTDDPTVWCVSAWNDNGFSGLVRDPTRLLRTQYFPGLGWMLKRELFKSELEEKWPKEHWDHWMRSETKFRTSQGRECVYPAVPRIYHNGVKGTFMDQTTHNKFFERIAYNQDPAFSWVGRAPGLREALRPDAYEARIQRLLEEGLLIAHRDLAPLVHGANQTFVLWYTTEPRYPAEFKAIGDFFGIWHEPRRAAHNGVHEFWFRKNYVVLANTKVSSAGGIESPYKDLEPDEKHVFTPAQFSQAVEHYEKARRRKAREKHASGK